MKRKNILIFTMFLLAFLFSFTACNESDADTYVITVLVSEGVSGTPAAGAYTLIDGSEMQYSFSLNPGYAKLTVLLNGTAVAASGKVTISGDRTLQAYAGDDFQYGLTVTLDEGVLGNPGAGARNYSQGTLVNYNYTLQEGYYGLVVTLDGLVVENSGTITMSRDHKLSVGATPSKQIQGTWELVETYDDDSTFTVLATFSGSTTQGTVTDSDGGSGTYAFINALIAFNLVFPDVTYEYIGSFTDNDTMKGSCRRYQSAETVVSGTWTATRKTAAAAAARQGSGSASGKKGTAR